MQGLVTAVDMDTPNLPCLLPEPLLLSTSVPACSLVWPEGAPVLPGVIQGGSEDNADKVMVLEGWGEAE